MRQVALLVAILAGGVAFGVVGQTSAAPGVVASPAASLSLIEKAGWRRYCRRYGCGPEAIYPGGVYPGAGYPGVDVVPGADVGVDVDVGVEAPAIVVLPPPRPLSCGEYRYWDGRACRDARYTDPYLGPK
jgi:hypothetical protein